MDTYHEEAATMLRQQADRIAELEKQGEPVAWMQMHHKDNIPTKFSPVKVWEDDIPLYTTPQTKPLSDEVLNKAFDYYCETDEGVLRFDFDLRTEWKQEQLQRWKEAFRKAWD